MTDILPPILSHGPDTEELLRRIANIRGGLLDISGLKITTLPDLPSGLQSLHCNDTPITSLPMLPSGLQRLWCWNTHLTQLPDLPSGLQELWCWNTHLTQLPDLPSALQILYCSYTPMILQRNKYESIVDYNTRWKNWREDEASKKRCKERSYAIKEELVMKVMHPRRIKKLLETGGYDLLDMF